MKLRIRGDSLRLRLSRSELDQLLAEGRVEEHMHVGAGRLTYVLQTTPDRESVAAELEGTTVRVWVPSGLARDWVETERVGFEAEQRDADRILKILVEKDFKCLVPRSDGEDQDSFANPAADAPLTGES
jgi:hypothetical protein